MDPKTSDNTSETKIKAEFVLKSSEAPPKYDSENWPLLLKNYDKMNVRTHHYTPIPQGCTPLKRPLKEYLKYGVINLDKPPRPSSHEVVTWAKNILLDLGISKTGHSGTLDPKVSGNLLITIDRATRLVKSQQNAGKQYICIVRFHGKVTKDTLVLALRHLHGPVYQRPPIISAVKRRLRVRTLHSVKLLEYNDKRGLAIIDMKCQAGTYVRTFCIHLGMLCGQAAHMQELRRVKSGHLGERDNMTTMHDLLDAKYFYDSTGNESYLRSIIMPLEILLIHLKRIVVKDTSVNAICHGAQIMLPGVLRFDNDIDIGDEVVIISTKGEAVCLAYAQMTTNQISAIDHGVVAKIKRVIMDRDTYPRRWGLGPYALKKKQMVKEGKLDKYGKVNEQTPKEWTQLHPDYSVQKYKEKVAADPSFVYIEKQKRGRVSVDVDHTLKIEEDVKLKKKKKKSDKSQKKKKRTAVQADLETIVAKEPPTKRIKLQVSKVEEVVGDKDLGQLVTSETENTNLKRVGKEEAEVDAILQKKLKKAKKKDKSERKKKKKKKKKKKSKGIEVN